MASISCSEAASELLRQCIAREPWSADLVSMLAREECTDALFRILIEGLADRFEAHLCNDYAAIFSLILQTVIPGYRAPDVYARYMRLREPRRLGFEPRRIAVLSRVTLGADIAITSVILDAMTRRYPQAELWFAGSAKAFELFAGDSKLHHFEVSYPRAGSLKERVHSCARITEHFDDEQTIVIDPESRFSQLGLLPVCAEPRHFFFESRAAGGDTAQNLTQLTRAWVQSVFGVEDATNRVSVRAMSHKTEGRRVAVSLGTADNPSKQLPPEFEAALIRLLCARFDSVIVDRGFGGDESARVASAIAGTAARAFSGSFAEFVSLIADSDCYVGYDSAGQHAAAACGTPLLVLFKGFASDRMFARWQPEGPGPKAVLKIADSITIEEVSSALQSLIRKS